MPIGVELSGANNDQKIHRAQVHDDGEFSGLVVFNAPLVKTDLQFAPLLNNDYGEDINQNGAFSGSPLRVHDGIDTSLWTGSSIVGGKVTFGSTDRALVGTKSMKVDNPTLNDIWQVAKGSALAVVDYVGATMGINIDKDWSEGDSVSLYAYDTGTASQVGATVFLENYMDEFQFDTWQTISIPFADLGLTTTDFDSFRMSMVAKGAGKAPKFYIDEWEVQQLGTPIQFRTNTTRGVPFRIDSLTFTFVDATTDTALKYDQLLGVSQLANGILLTRFVDGQPTFATSLRDLRDFIKLGFEVVEYHADGTNAILSLRTSFKSALPVYGGSTSYLAVTISDDLTGFIHATVAARGNIDL